MGDTFITDFKFGVDRRRQRVAGMPGTLWTGQNVVISRGGDIERCLRIAPIAVLPTGQTFGLAAVRNQLYSFGSTAPGSLSPPMPVGVQYQQLVSPSGAAMTAVLDARATAGLLYVIAKFADGNVFHFYNGARVTDWDALADSSFTYPVLADYIASVIDVDTNVHAAASGNTVTFTARVPGVPFSLFTTVVNGGSVGDQTFAQATPQASVSASPATAPTATVSVLASGSGQINAFTINGVNVLSAPVSGAGAFSQVAAALAISINNSFNAAVGGYVAAASGTTVAITAPIGTADNGFATAFTATGDVLISTPTLAGGALAIDAVAQVCTVTLGGTPEALDIYTVVINSTTYKIIGRAASTGTSAFVASKRVFSTAGSLLAWSELNTPSNWSSDSGSPTGTGFINVSSDTEGSERLVGVGKYFNQMAVMSRINSRVYTLSADATTIAIVQPIDNTGTFASRSIMGYGTDLFYLSDTGIRSLRARDASNIAFVNDIGVAIDSLVRAQLDSLTSDAYSRAVSIYEPRDGRFMLAIGNTIYTLSYFPGSSISAWTTIDPGFTVSDFAREANLLFMRGGDTVYQYGGVSGIEYPRAGELPAYIELPFAATTPPGRGQFLGYDQAATNEWVVQALVDPDDETQRVNIGTLDRITYGQDDITLPGRATHVAFNLTCSAAGYASISNINFTDNNREEQAKH